MQTSSNFFNKNLLGNEGQFRTKKTDEYHQYQSLPDPLSLKQDLTPWTEINPKYNFNTQRLIKIKKRINHQPKSNSFKHQVKQIKIQMISDQFNFYKNNKQKKRLTSDQTKTKIKSRSFSVDPKIISNDWTLPPLKDKVLIQDNLSCNQIKKKVQQQKIQENKQTNAKKRKQTFIESMSIRQYLNKQKQKQKIAQLTQKMDRNNQRNSFRSIDSDQFTSNRYQGKRQKQIFKNSIILTKQLRSAELNYEYSVIKNPQSLTIKKRSNFSSLESLQQSFQMYKKAAYKQVNQSSVDKESIDKNLNKLGLNFAFAQKNIFKSNFPLGYLFSSSDSYRKKQNGYLSKRTQSNREYSTIL